MRTLRPILALAASLSLLFAGVPQGHAEDTELPPLDLETFYGLYSPEPDLDELDNWRTYNAYNVVNHVAENLPHRQPNDQTSDDPEGDNPLCRAWGPQCDYNHQLEYLDWFEQAYSGIFGEFGVTFRTYEFTSPGDSTGNFSTNAGRALNTFAIVPGADHPEDIVMIGSHYDGVDGSPHAAWDSTAGSGTLVRTAKILADYWKATGTRPSKTYIFAAWDAEEAGGVGSKFWVLNGLPKDPDVTLTAYINHDPCGGHYPALYRGMPAGRNPAVEPTGFVPVNVALHQPRGGAEKRARMTAFNNSIPGILHEMFEGIDDTLPVVTPVPDTPAEIPVFLSTDEAEAMGSPELEQEHLMNVNTKGLLFFTTDAEDFPVDIPTLNPYPDNVGPHAVSTDPKDLGWGPDGLWAYHSPHDNWNQLVAQTSVDQSGLTYSKGLAMSFEWCSMFSARTMLEPTQGGAAPVTDDVVAYFETPKPNQNGGVHVFDASGSYRYTDIETPALKSGDQLLYEWDFGDGTTGSTGRVVEHEFADAGLHTVTLTVTDPDTIGTENVRSDTMRLRIGTP